MWALVLRKVWLTKKEQAALSSLVERVGLVVEVVWIVTVWVAAGVRNIVLRKSSILDNEGNLPRLVLLALPRLVGVRPAVLGATEVYFVTVGECCISRVDAILSVDGSSHSEMVPEVVLVGCEGDHFDAFSNFMSKWLSGWIVLQFTSTFQFTHQFCSFASFSFFNLNFPFNTRR